MKSGNDLKYFLIVLFSLLFFGVIAVYDVSVVYAAEIFSKRYYFLVLQLLWAMLGLISFSFFYRTDYKIILKFSKVFFVFSTILLAILAFASFFKVDLPFFPMINGAKRWILLNPEPFPRIPIIGVLSLQPSELFKLAFILYFSIFLSSTKKTNHEYEPFLRVLLLLFCILGLIMLQPDLGTALVILFTAAVMYFASGEKIKYLLMGIPLALIFTLIIILPSPYRRERLMTYINGAEKKDELGTSYHINQVMIALGSGGVTGVGFGKSRQKYQYIPEAATDSIIAIIGEELGFLGVSVLVFSFLYLINKGLIIASHAPDRLSMLIAIGVVGWFAGQSFINLFSMVHLIPLTGVPLPLISYGGSSLIFMLSGFGILSNISKNSR